MNESNFYAEKIVKIRHNFKDLTFKCRQSWATAINEGFNAAEVVFINFGMETYLSQLIRENADTSRL
jgi:hypothetical protein